MHATTAQSLGYSKHAKPRLFSKKEDRADGGASFSDTGEDHGW